MTFTIELPRTRRLRELEEELRRQREQYYAVVEALHQLAAATGHRLKRKSEYTHIPEWTLVKAEDI